MDILNKNNLYIHPLEDFLPIQKNFFFLLYAPLSTIALIATAKDIDKIKAYLGGENFDEEFEELMLSLLDKSPSEESLSQRIRSTSDFVNLSLLLNNKCNFNCSYCYSAQGRSNEEIDEERLKIALDYFINNKRGNHNELSLTFLGGGEPMISKGLLTRAVNYSNELAKQNDVRVWIKIVTNGSLLEDCDIPFLLSNDIELTVSFEILKDIQNLQRKHYDRVRNNIQSLSSQGVMISINSVISVNNVERQKEMIEELIREYSHVKYVSFEPIMELNEWSAKDIDSEFYDSYIRHFFEAYSLAKENGIDLSCSLLRNVDCVVERYCAGEFAVCPDGSITICPCISSSEMDNYHKFVYGKIQADGVCIDKEKMEKLLSEDVNSYNKCQPCFAKWNCGGGCINTNMIESSANKAIKCDFVRKFTKEVIWQRLRLEYESSAGKDIMEILNEYE